LSIRLRFRGAEMTETKNYQTKSGTGVVDKQSLYKYLYSLLPFELFIVILAGLSWVILRELSCLWVILGIGQLMIIGSVIMAVRDYSAALIVQKMKERSVDAKQQSPQEEALQETTVGEQGNTPEFKIIATSASDLPKLSANEQTVFDTLSSNLKREYILWSINIYLLLIILLLIAWSDGETSYLPGIEVTVFILCAFRLAAIGNDTKRAVATPIPRDLTTQEPKGMKIGLTVYIALRIILYTVYGHPGTFLLTMIDVVFAVNIFMNALLYGLRWKVKRQRLPKINILALWVFGTQNIWELLEYLILPVWRKLGNIYLIRGGEHILKQVSLLDSLMFLQGKDKIISKTPEQITQKLNEFKDKTDKSLEYRFNTLICGDNSWQFALHSLIDNADLVVMHLSSFSPSNQGCIYELEQLINCVPVENFYLLVDRHSTDYDFLLKKLQELWKKKKSSSPNQKEQSQGIQIIFLEHAVKIPDEVEAIYANMNALQQDAMAVLSDQHNKELVIQHETRKRQELDGLFRVLFAKAVQLSHTLEPHLSP